MRSNVIEYSYRRFKQFYFRVYLFQISCRVVFYLWPLFGKGLKIIVKFYYIYIENKGKRIQQHIFRCFSLYPRHGEYILFQLIFILFYRQMEFASLFGPLTTLAIDGFVALPSLVFGIVTKH